MNEVSVAVQSASILLREGIEAMLVVSALAAFLRRACGTLELRAVYAGVASAVLASVLAAIVFDVFLGGAHDDRMEAAVMLIAVGLMLYMSGWLFLRQDPRAWNAALQASARRAMGAGASTSLGLIAFLAVFREGSETVLFLHALARANGGWTSGFFAGLAAALMLIGSIYVAIQWLAFRFPLRPIFLLTSTFLFLMGLRFIGGAMQELQEQTIVPYDGVTLPDWLLALGINPTWEALGAQLVVAMIAIAGTLVLYGRRTLATVKIK
jgi:high-affinity iron transporter